MKTVFQLVALDPPGLLIGGFAMQRYGLSRQTFDVDMLIAHAQKEKLASALLEAGYAAIAETDSFVRYRCDNLYLMDIDVLLVDSDTLDKMLAASIVITVDDVDLRVPSLSHLVALKLHAVTNNAERSTKDLADIAELLRANPDAVSPKELDAVCTKYGTSEAVEKLKAML
jgi:hypothetical protein